MPAPSRRKHLNLAAAWDAYGHAVAFNDLFDIKIGRHGYVALAWLLPDGSVEYADLASPDGGVTWEMQNDCCGDAITLSQWRRAKVVPECDWLSVPEEAAA